MPNTLLTAILSGAELPDGPVGLCNLTPYDGCMENSAARFHLRDGLARKVRTLSIGFDLEPLTFSEKSLGMTFMQERGVGDHVPFFFNRTAL